MNDRETWTSELFGIVIDPATLRVLLVERDAGWALPAATVANERHLTTELATQELRDATGLPVIANRFARITKDDARRDREGVFVLDAIAPLPTALPDPAAVCPDTGRWVSRDDLASLPLAHPGHRAVLDDVLRELETGERPRFRQPWEQPGWYAEATSWIEAALESLGREMTTPPVQVQWWSLSAVMRVGTAGGDLYFKAATLDQPLFCNEPIVTAWLGGRFPGQVPALVASDPGRGWMLLEDAGTEVGYDVPLERKAELFAAFAALQRDTAGQIDALLALGCADRRPDRLIPRVERLLGDESVLKAVPEDDRREFRRRLPAIAEMCRRLADSEVPPTLIHGDLHLGNVAGRDGTVAFFEWTDASVSHPFVDMFMIFGERDEACRNRLRDAYLAIWTDFATMERLRELWSLAAVVHALHHAVSYHMILEHIEERAKAEVERAVPAYLGRALRSLRDPA